MLATARQKAWFWLCAHLPLLLPIPFAVLGIAWLLWHPSPGYSVGILALAAVVMTVRDQMSRKEKILWVAVAGILTVAELASISADRAEQNRQFQETAKEIKGTSNKSDKIIALSQSIIDLLQQESRARQSEQQQSDSATYNRRIQSLIEAWGKASLLNTPRAQGATATPQQPAQIPQGRRVLDAEKLGSELKPYAPSAATIISDGTNEAGNFAKQLEIGLRFGGWQAGGDNIKMGDPAFFPDSLTLEVSEKPASRDDHSKESAALLKQILAKNGIEAMVRFTELEFPPNFMRIKVAGR